MFLALSRFWLPMILALSLGGSLALTAADDSATAPAAMDTPATEASPSEQPTGSEPAAESTREPTPPQGRSVQTVLEAQVELHRRGFSCGSIDGVAGAQTAGALRAFQRFVGIPDTGRLDAATRTHLELTSPALDVHVFSPTELGGLHAVPATWLEKSQLETLAYATPLELVAERYHANPNLIKQLNPSVNWARILPGTRVIVPAVTRVTVTGTANEIVIMLGARELDVLDDTSRVIAHFPVSIARMVEKRPVGDLHVTVIIPDPDYTFDPEVFPESEEARTLGRKLIIPPGPNNPVGRAWIGLDRAGYGIHGTPEPEKVGRTESHGCFRLANWDVLTLLPLVRVGMHVVVEP